MNHIAAAAVFTLAGASLAQAPVPKAKGIESPGYTWNARGGEKNQALKLKGDLTKGEEAYEVCSACHLPSGAGRPDGTFPQLAGQHPTVLIKQLADIRAKLRDNPIMYPFSTTITDPQELANVAAYLGSLPVPRDNGRGQGVPAVLAVGKALYLRDCVKCHGANGEGDARRFFPMLAGQHYKYLLRQATEIRDGKRRNANPEMVKIIKPYTDAELDAIADYMSRLQVPEHGR